MKFITATVLILLVNSVLSGRRSSELSEAFTSLTKALVESSTYLSFVASSNDSKSAICHRSFANGVSFTVRRFGSDDNSFELNTSAIVSVDSIDELIDFNENVVLTNNYSKPFQFFIHCDGATMEELSNLEENDKTKAIFQFEYFVVDQGEYIRLMTFVWHTATACNQPQLVEVNRFSKKNRKWETDKFRLNKFENFHGCTLRFGFIASFPSYLPTMPNKKTGKSGCHGFLCEASNAIAKHVNSEVVEMLDPNNGLCLLGSDFCWAVYSIVDTFNSKKLFASQVLMSSDDLIAVPPPESYNGYEKLLLPFDDATWFWIVMTFSFLFGAIFVLQFSKPFVKDFVFGRNVTAPVLTVLRAFFGISHPQTPGRNFARFLLMLVVIFSLIVRTAYQAKMFEFLQKEMLKSNVKSIKEMIDKNYTFYVTEGFGTSLDKENYFGQCTVIEMDPFIIIHNMSDLESKVGEKIAVEVRQELLFMSRFETKGKISNRIINDRILLDMKVLVAEPHNKLFDLIDRKTQQLFEGGHFNYYFAIVLRLLDKKRFEEYHEPFKILTFDELEAGFVICFVPLLSAIAVFGLEWLVVLKDYILVRCTLEGFFKIHRDVLNAQSENLELKVTTWQKILKERKRQLSVSQKADLSEHPVEERHVMSPELLEEAISDILLLEID